MFFGMLSCDTKPEEQHHEHVANEEVYYTCSMHPSVIADQPGRCPICGMNLIKKTFQKSDRHGEMLHINEQQQWLANITTDTAQMKNISAYRTINGTVVRDESQVEMIVARISGRIEKLFVRNPADKITKGEALFELYSEQLKSDESDYLNALQQKNKFPEQQKLIDEMIQGAKQKLLLWGLSDQQVMDLKKAGRPSSNITFYSDADGYITQLLVHEGQTVNEGEALFEISKLDTVWVEAQFYANDPSIKTSPHLLVSFDAFPGEIFKGELVFNSPEIGENTTINKIKISIDNPSGKIKPGMMAYVQLKENSKKTLVVPKSALLAEKMKVLWIQLQPGMFERKMVQTGIENKEEVEIINGIKTGDIIVVSGVYLLNSEFILKNGGTMKHQH